MPGITFNPFFPLKICSCAANQHPAVIQDYYFPVTALILRTTVLDIKRTVPEHFANYLIHILWIIFTCMIITSLAQSHRHNFTDIIYSTQVSTLLHGMLSTPWKEIPSISDPSI